MNVRSLSACLYSMICVAAVVLCLAPPVSGQGVRRPGAATAAPAARPDSDEVRIRKLTGLGSKGMVKSPVFHASSGRASNKPPGDWVQITVEYATAPEWIDELVFQYSVLTLTVIDGKKAYSLFKNTVRYADIERNARHYSTVFLRPNTVKRYGEPVGVAVEISHKGKVVAVDNDIVRAIGLPEGDWWKDPRVTESNTVVTRDGYLLNRSETPFALIDIDDYETIR